MKILIAEDDSKSLALIRKYLEAKSHVVMAARDGREALERFSQENPDIVLLDVMMPKMDGWGVLEEIRKTSNTPVIMVTVKDSTEDKVRGLSSGVDDYITKPFDLREVEARIEAVMRRYKSAVSQLEIGSLLIDDEKKQVTIEGRPIELSPKEYDLLLFLASKPGRVFSQEEILQNVWAASTYAGAEDVKKYIYLLRNKIEKNPEDPQIILTVRGFGYKLNA